MKLFECMYFSCYDDNEEPKKTTYPLFRSHKMVLNHLWFIDLY